MSSGPFDFDAVSLALLDGCAHLRALIAGTNLVDADDLTDTDYTDRQQAAEQLALIVEHTAELTARLQLHEAVADAWQRDCEPARPDRVIAQITGRDTDPGTYVVGHLLVDRLYGAVRIRGIDDELATSDEFQETAALIVSLEDSAELVRRISQAWEDEPRTDARWDRP